MLFGMPLVTTLELGTTMNLHDKNAEVLGLARDFADTRIRPYAAVFDERGELPMDLIKELGRLRFLGARLPKKFGGLELDPLIYGLLTETIGRACSSTRTLLTVHVSLICETLLRWSNAEQQARWLPRLATGDWLAAFALTEPDVGSDAKSIRTSYRRVGDTYVLNGRKKWISFGAIADVFLVFAVDGPGMGAFLVEKDAPGVEIKQIGGILSQRATHLAEISLTEVCVGADAVVGSDHCAGHFILPSALDHGRYSIAWAGVALAREALSQMVSYSKQREQFGKKISEFQLIRGMIGDATSVVHAARALCLRAAELRAAQAPTAAFETTIAKYFASKAAAQVSSDAVQVHGANGLSREYASERLFRDAKALEIIEGSSQIQQLIISKYVLDEAGDA